MNLQELEWYSDGFFLRTAKDHEGLRRIWMVLHNVNYKNKIESISAIHNAWPLYHDPMEKVVNADTAQYQLEMLQEFKAKRDADGRTSNNTNQSGN